MDQEKKALIILHQSRSSYGDVGIKLKQRGFKLDIKKPALGESLPQNMNDHDVAIMSEMFQKDSPPQQDATSMKTSVISNLEPQMAP